MNVIESARNELSACLIGVYEALIDWGDRTRTINARDDFSVLVPLLASLADGPIQNIRDFIDEISGSLVDLPSRIERSRLSGEQIRIKQSLDLKLDAGVLAQINQAVSRYAASH